MLDKIYLFFHRLFSKPQERGEYSAGYWQDQIRGNALSLCPDIQGRLLEIGCGEGLFLGQAAEKLPELELWGIDNNGLRIEQAGQKFRGKKISFSVGDATRLNFNDEFFDVVVCINVFFNMPDAEIVRKTLQEARRVLKKEGVIIFDFRNRANLLLALKYGLAPLYDKTVKDLPLKTYYWGQFEKMLQELHLKTVEKCTLGFAWKKFAPLIMIKAKKDD